MNLNVVGLQLKIQHDFIAVTEILLNKQAVTRSVRVSVSQTFLQTSGKTFRPQQTRQR